MESFPNLAHNNRAITLPENEQLLAPLGLSGLLGYTGTVPVYSDATGGRAVKLRAGVKATIRGTRFNNATETVIGSDVIVANTSGLPRIDLVVLRLNREAVSPNAYTITPVVITGVPAATPLVPSPVRNDTTDGSGFWDIPLADFDVPNGATSIAVDKVRNRAWWVTGSGYTGLDAARPPVEAGVVFRANDTGITWMGTAAGGWQRLYYNTGWVNVTPPTGWAASTFSFARVGDLVVMSARITRTGAAVAATTSPVLYTVTEPFRPSQEVFGTYHCSHPDHSSHVVVGTDGTITFGGTGTTGQHIEQGASLLSNMVWPAAE